MLLIIDNRSYLLINSNPYQEALNCDDTSTHDGIVRFTSGKGLEVETEDMDSTEVLPLARFEESCIASESFPAKEESQEEMR